jgi:hypothetical protein
MDNKKTVYLISCVSKKLPFRAKAEQLYTSPFFKYNLKYAQMMNADEIYVLSAKYGLVPIDKEIDPYELTLNTMKKPEIEKWSKRVLSELNEVTDINNTHFVFLAGSNYREFLIPLMNSYDVPFEGLGIGEQLGALKKATASYNPGFANLFE